MKKLNFFLWTWIMLKMLFTAPIFFFLFLVDAFKNMEWRNPFACKHVTKTYPKGVCIKCKREVDLSFKSYWKKL